MPEGFFDHSPEGESLVAFHVNKGAGKQAELYSIDRFYKMYFRPDLVRMRLEGKESEKVDSAYSEAKSLQELLELGLPPEIALSHRVKGNDAILETELVDCGGGVGAVHYYLNGVRVAEGPPPSSKVQEGAVYKVKQSIPLYPGHNVIEVRSYSPLSNIETETLATEIFTEQAEVQGRTLYILSVGIDKYSVSGMGLDYAVSDSLLLSKTLRNNVHNRFAKVRNITLTDAKATRDTILQAIRDLSCEIKQQDCFILYLSGHGVNVDSNYYFLTSELTAPTRTGVYSSGLSQQELTSVLTEITALESLIILDTCEASSFSGSIAALSMKLASGKLNRATGRAVLTASAKEAIEGYNKHGVFTYFLIQGLKGMAENKLPDHQISILEAGNYVLSNVPRITREKWGFEQLPSFYHRGKDFFLTKLN